MKEKNIIPIEEPIVNTFEEIKALNAEEKEKIKNTIEKLPTWNIEPPIEIKRGN